MHKQAYADNLHFKYVLWWSPNGSVSLLLVVNTLWEGCKKTICNIFDLRKQHAAKN